MKLARRLFVVPLADNDHGKTTMIRALVAQGLGQALKKSKKGVRSLASPFGRIIDAYVFGRSYQEVEKGDYGSVTNALAGNDPDWYRRELIVMPSHVSGIGNGNGKPDDIDQIIDAAHGAGFDVICAAIVFTDGNQNEWTQFQGIWKKGWDERWTIPNPHEENPAGQLDALGRDLWVWICKALAA